MNRLSDFEIRPGETVLYRARTNRQWYRVVWKIISGLVIVLVANLVIFGIVSRWYEWLAIPILILTIMFSLGYVIEDLVRFYTSDFALSDLRFWTRGHPYAWSPAQEILLDDIDSLVYRREAVFLRRKSNRKVLVYMVPDGKALAKAFKEWQGKNHQTR
jgi:hypothetical protein